MGVGGRGAGKLFRALCQIGFSKKAKLKSNNVATTGNEAKV